MKASNVSNLRQSDASQPNSRLAQNYFLIWIDENIDLENTECQKVTSRLKKIATKVHAMTCVDSVYLFCDKRDKYEV